MCILAQVTMAFPPRTSRLGKGRSRPEFPHGDSAATGIANVWMHWDHREPSLYRGSVKKFAAARFKSKGGCHIHLCPHQNAGAEHRNRNVLDALLSTRLPSRPALPEREGITYGVASKTQPCPVDGKPPAS